MRIDRDRALAAFLGYVGAYDPASPRIRLKIDHTMRVAELAGRVASSEGLPPDDVDLAWLCGLLHDIGRFEQVRIYDTFSDAASFSHAAMGVRVLFGEADEAVDRTGAEAGSGTDAPPIRSFVEADDEDDIIRTAIELHSEWRLPETLGPRARLFCDILRDADKVDIVKATRLEPCKAIFGVAEGELLGSEVSPGVVSAFYEHRTVRRDERAHPADIAVGFSCFAFELVFAESLRQMHGQGCVYELLDLPFTHVGTREAFARMGEHMRAWVAGRLAEG